MIAATGEQYELLHASASGRSRAIVRQVAAGLRGLWFDGVAAVESHPESVVPPMGAGIVLVPWPNRVRDGRWTWRGRIQQLDLTDPASRNATHGLLRNTAYTVLERDVSDILLGAAVFPQHGYPFLLDTRVRYSLGEDGLTVTHTVSNLGEDAAPVAVGTHPYLRVGDWDASDLTVTVLADTVAPAGERGLPEPACSVAGTGLDLRNGRRVSELDVDACYSDLTAQDGVVEHALSAPDGSRTTLWAESVFAYAQVFTPRDFPGETGERQAIAIEPMTAPPDALNSGHGLRWIEPGETWSVRWGIRYRPAR